MPVKPTHELCNVKNNQAIHKEGMLFKYDVAAG